MSDLLEFARSIHVQWTQNKLCEIDVTEERHFLDGVTLGRTMPLLWRMLQSCLFTVVVIQKALLERLLTSSNTTTNEVARLAVDTLSILHNLNFITTRGQYTVLSDYQYVYLSSVDLLASHPRQLDSFFKNLQVFHRGLLPVHPLERASDLFQLNLAEKSMLALSSTFCETSVLRLACDYLQAQAEPKLRDIREAAHSTVLALLVTQKTRAILEELLPFYLRLVLQEYPGHMNFSQFNLAIKTMIQASNASRSDLEGHSV
ncbi:hypothetical protein MMC25_008360, partial [Agyrium rufum]|nr:hypothetical protein [Agyrium rufum]